MDEKLTDKANTICLYKILEQYSDDEHVLSMKEIIEKFYEDYGLRIDRRTIYSSIKTLQKLHYDVSDFDKERRGYYLRARLFEPSEVRLMMDAVYSMSSIPQKQTNDLIEKLQSTCSVHQKKMYRHLFASEPDRKTQNRTVFLNIDELENAIAARKKVEFTYMEYRLDKRLHPRQRGRYTVSPYSMMCDKKKYYLICIMDGKEGTSNYRIDLMKDIRILDEPVVLPPSEVDLNSARKTVYAYSGKPVDIVLRCTNKGQTIGGLIDEFGSGIKLESVDADHFIARFRSIPQGVLYWTMQYLGDVEILEPLEMREKAIEMLRSNPYGVSIETEK